MSDTPTPGPSPTQQSVMLPQAAPDPTQHQHHAHPVGNGQPVMPDGRPLPQPLVSQTERAVKRYATVREGVLPHIAQIGDRTITFNRKPNARAQTQLMGMLVHFEGGFEVTPATIGKVQDLIADLESSLRTMIAEEQAELLDWLFEQLGLEELAELASDAMEQLTTRPTTGSSGSSPSQPPTTSTTGLTAPGLPVPTSTG
jgi:hypothetical protein